MAKYNGHRSWNAWNVSLWINNDAGLYQFAKECLECFTTRKIAAEEFVDCMRVQFNMPKTPDGAPYTVTSVYEAMEGID